MSNTRIIKTVREAEEALSLLVRRKHQNELATIRRAARNIANSKGGKPGREQALRAVLMGFSDNIEEMAS